eukprot:TRINITY_DN27127_c0_g2_i1.p1 TRINITY_DN27127_c0_g2~~TRINITY_DN27127_c0_g2_i1.p1  ORF type:complete len:384 (+),score=99.99 TRINITY_DN27127_c0_g2_i1:118-1152(+)
MEAERQDDQLDQVPEAPEFDLEEPDFLPDPAEEERMHLYQDEANVEEAYSNDLYENELTEHPESNPEPHVDKTVEEVSDDIDSAPQLPSFDVRSQSNSVQDGFALPSFEVQSENRSKHGSFMTVVNRSSTNSVQEDHPALPSFDGTSVQRSYKNSIVSQMNSLESTRTDLMSPPIPTFDGGQILYIRCPSKPLQLEDDDFGSAPQAPSFDGSQEEKAFQRVQLDDEPLEEEQPPLPSFDGHSLKELVENHHREPDFSPPPPVPDFDAAADSSFSLPSTQAAISPRKLITSNSGMFPVRTKATLQKHSAADVLPQLGRPKVKPKSVQGGLALQMPLKKTKTDELL